MIYTNALEKHGDVIQEEYEILLKLLTPFAPHIAEELWHSIGHTDSIHIQSWPAYDPKKIETDEVVLAIQVDGKVRTSLSTIRDQDEEEVKALALALPEVKKWLDGKEPKRVIVVPGRIVSIVTWHVFVLWYK